METAKATGFKKHLPNIASIIRIVGTFSLPFLMWESWEKTVNLPVLGEYKNVPLIWIIVYLVLVFTDKVDGTLARKLNAESELGANLDALGDALVLVMGATLCFVRFVADKLEAWQMWLYIGMMVITVINKVVVFVFAQKYHGKGNMLHSYAQKFFAVICFIGVAYWAFMRTIPAWSISFMLAVNIYATIDECIYCVRSAEYNVDFKGHGFEKYKLRDKK